MDKFFTIVCAYLIGACIINYICVKFLLHIPLIDYRAIGIRNILCVIWLIIVTLGCIFTPTTK